MEEAGGRSGFYALPNGRTVHACFPAFDKLKGHRVSLLRPPVTPWHKGELWPSLITAAQVITFYLTPGRPLQYFTKVWFPVPMLGPLPLRNTLQAVKGKTGASIILMPSAVQMRATLEKIERVQVTETPIEPKKPEKKGAKKK